MHGDPATIARTLERRSRELPDALAFGFGGQSLTFRQLHEQAESLAAMLAKEVQHGDRVALVMPAGLELVTLFYAVQRIGAVSCIFDPHLPAATVERRVASIRPRLALTAVPAGSAAPLPPIDDDPDAVAFLQQTSGTSGEPLAAIALQRNVIASMEGTRARIEPRADDVLVGWVPPWHDLGLLRFLLGPVYYALPCHLIAPAVRTIPEWFATISAVRGTITGAPDFAWRLATRLVDPGTVDLRSLRWATNGGEPVRASTIDAFESRFGIERVICPGYGLAEATLGVSTSLPGEPLRTDGRGNVACGRPMDNIEVTIDGGEIVVRGPNVFAGYFEAPEATARVLRDGALYTGDHGALDADGNVYVHGRQRAMIKRGGAMLAPRELEEAAHTVAGVRIAAAVGVPSALTEELVVVVETEDDASTIADRVADVIERTIGFAPDRVLVQPRHTIPRTANGKIRHAVLRDQLTPSNLRSSPSVISDGRASR